MKILLRESTFLSLWRRPREKKKALFCQGWRGHNVSEGTVLQITCWRRNGLAIHQLLIRLQCCTVSVFSVSARWFCVFCESHTYQMMALWRGCALVALCSLPLAAKDGTADGLITHLNDTKAIYLYLSLLWSSSLPQWSFFTSIPTSTFSNLPFCLTSISFCLFSFVSFHSLSFTYLSPISPFVLHPFVVSASSSLKSCLSVSGVNPQVTHTHTKLTAPIMTYYCLSLHPFPKLAHNRKYPCYLYRQWPINITLRQRGTHILFNRIEC